MGKPNFSSCHQGSIQVLTPNAVGNFHQGNSETHVLGSYRAPVKHFTSESRYVVTEWMYQVCERIFKSRDEARRVFHTSVFGLDKVLSGGALLAAPEFVPVLQSEAYLQLTGLSCVVLAINHLKLQGKLTSPTPPAERMLGFCGSKYSQDQYTALLAQIEFRLQPFAQLSTCLDVLESLPQRFAGLQALSAISHLAFVLADSYLLEFSTLRHKAEDVALSAFLVAKRLVEKDNSPPSLSVNKNCFDEFFYVAYQLFKDEQKSN